MRRRDLPLHDTRAPTSLTADRAARMGSASAQVWGSGVLHAARAHATEPPGCASAALPRAATWSDAGRLGGAVLQRRHMCRDITWGRGTATT
jgi:hypothetical protein